MQKRSTKPSITRYYDQEFGSNPEMLMNDASSEIIAWASIHDIDLGKIFSNIRLVEHGSEDKFTKYASYAEMNSALPPALKGKATLISHVRTTKNGGIRYPYLALLIKGSIESVWNGYEYLLNAFEYANHDQLSNEQKAEAQKVRDDKKRQFKAQQAKKEQERAKRDAELEAKRQADILWLNHYRETFNQAEAEMGNGPYFSRKMIGNIVTMSNVRRMSDDRVGMHTSIPFTKLAGKGRGTMVAFQRILDKPITIKGKTQGKLTTVTTESDALKGAVHIFGDLVNGQRIIVGEGYATVASAMLAKNATSGVMAYSANNLKEVADILRRNYPESELYILVDNDHATCQKGEGNAGMLAAISILRKHHSSGKVKCYVPTFDGMSSESQHSSSDFNDIHVKLGLSEVSKQVGATSNRINWDITALARNLFELRYVKDNKVKSTIKKAVLSGMNMVPNRFSRNELQSMIDEELHRLAKRRTKFNFKAELNNLNHFMNRVYAAHTNRAMAFRSFSNRIKNPETRPANVNYVQFNQYQVNDEIVNYIRGCTGPVILRAGMGSRKSSKAIRHLMRESEKGILTAHRQTLTHDLYRTMADAKEYDAFGLDKDILHYQDEGITEMAPYAKKLVCCVNSIIKGIFRPIMTTHDFFGMDEATQTLRSVLTGNAMAYPVDVYNMLKTSIAATDGTVLLCDADANDHLISLLERANEQREELGLQPWPQINVIDLPVNVEVEVDKVTRSRIRIDYSDPNSTFLQIQNAINNKERVLVATDSTRFAEQVREHVKQNNELTGSETKVLYVSQDTKPEERVKRFQDNPEVEAKHYDVLIYSPAISSGVSINVRHFTRHFGVFYGEIVPSDAIQMLRRDRKATQFTLGLGVMNHNRETDLMRMVRSFVEVSKDAKCSLNIQDGTFSLGTHDTEFNRARMELMIEENRARAEFANQILRILEADGYDVHRMDTFEADIEMGKAERKALQGHIEARKERLHLTVPTPSDDRKEDLLNMNSLSEAERAELNRWDMEHYLCDEVSSELYEFWKDGGMSKAKRFELLMMDQAKAEHIDELEQRTEFVYKVQTEGSQYPQSFVYRATTEAEAEHAMHRQFAGVRIQFNGEEQIKEEQATGIIECAVIGKGKTDHRRIVAMSRDEATKIIYKEYFKDKVLSLTQAPVVEISKRQYLSINRSKFVQFFLDLGIDPVTGKNEATQESMKAAIDRLIKTEADRDVFNNVCTLWGGRLDAFGKKRPTDMFKLVCEQLGLKAQSRRLPRRTQGGGVVWSIEPNSWAEMVSLNDKRRERHVTSYEFEALENCAQPMIHDVNSNLIYTETNVDHQDYIKESYSTPWIQLLETATKLVNLPLDWASGLLNEDEQSLFVSGKMKLSHLCMFLRDQYIIEKGYALTGGEFYRLKNWSPVEC
jgi:phage/plasmid primase-like uncharacterized protein